MQPSFSCKGSFWVRNILHRWLILQMNVNKNLSFNWVSQVESSSCSFLFKVICIIKILLIHNSDRKNNLIWSRLKSDHLTPNEGRLKFLCAASARRAPSFSTCISNRTNDENKSYWICCWSVILIGKKRFIHKKRCSYLMMMMRLQLMQRAGVRDNTIFCTHASTAYTPYIAARTLTQWPDGRRLRCERVGFQHRELFVTSGEKKHNKKITCCLNTCVDEK